MISSIITHGQDYKVISQSKWGVKRDNTKFRFLTLSKGNGKRLYKGVEFANGSYSKPFLLPKI